MRIGLDQAAGGTRQIGSVEPGIAGQSRHEDDDVGGKFATFGFDLAGFETEQLVPEMGGDVAALHFPHQALQRLFAEAMAGVGHRIEEGELDLLAAAFAPQLGVEPEQEFENRPAAHGRRLVGVTGEAEGHGPALQGGDPLAQALHRSDALAGQDGVLDARQLLDEAPAAGDDESVIFRRACRGQYRAPAVGETRGLARDKIDVVRAQELVQRHHQVLGLALARRQPDEAGQVDEFAARRDQADAHAGIEPTQAPGGAQGGKTAADDACFLAHVISPFDAMRRSVRPPPVRSRAARWGSPPTA